MTLTYVPSKGVLSSGMVYLGYSENSLTTVPTDINEFVQTFKGVRGTSSKVVKFHRRFSKDQDRYFVR